MPPCAGAVICAAGRPTEKTETVSPNSLRAAIRPPARPNAMPEAAEPCSTVIGDPAIWVSTPPDPTENTDALPLELPVASKLSGLNATLTGDRLTAPSIVGNGEPAACVKVLVWKTETSLPSRSAAASRLPSGLNATASGNVDAPVLRGLPATWLPTTPS